jgi:fatty acid desaturase
VITGKRTALGSRRGYAMSDQDPKKGKDERSRLVGGIIVLGIGVVFLLSNLGVIPHIGRTWPLILIVVGFALLVGALRKRDQSGPTTLSPQ